MSRGGLVAPALAYTVSAKKIPFFVESMTSTWSVLLPGADDSHASVAIWQGMVASEAPAQDGGLS